MSDDELTRIADMLEAQRRREEARVLKLAPVKPMRVLRALFGHDVESPGDRIELDGAEEPSGRIGFSLIGKDGETKRCGITPAYTTVIEVPDPDLANEEERARGRNARAIEALSCMGDPMINAHASEPEACGDCFSCNLYECLKEK